MNQATIDSYIKSVFKYQTLEPTIKRQSKIYSNKANLPNKKLDIQSNYRRSSTIIEANLEKIHDTLKKPLMEALSEDEEESSLSDTTPIVTSAIHTNSSGFKVRNEFEELIRKTQGRMMIRKDILSSKTPYQDFFTDGFTVSKLDERFKHLS